MAAGPCRAARAAAGLVAPGAHLVAVEANISCPNLEDRRRMFAHGPRGPPRPSAAVAAGLARTAAPVGQAEPQRDRSGALAAAAVRAGAGALTLVNTLMGLALDPATGRPRLGGGGGGCRARPSTR